MNLSATILAPYAVMSTITFIAFALDKNASVRGQRRTPEARLHVLELLGGWPGALLAMSLLRHKNRKATYIAVVVCIVAVHGVA